MVIGFFLKNVGPASINGDSIFSEVIIEVITNSKNSP